MERGGTGREMTEGGGERERGNEWEMRRRRRRRVDLRQGMRR